MPPSRSFPASLRVARPQTRLFSTTPPTRSALFNLGGLSASREGQYLSKETGIPRTEYSSNIHLIRSSEVDPFPNAPGATKQAKNNDRRQQPLPRPIFPAAPVAQPKRAPTSARTQKQLFEKPITFDALVAEHKLNKEALGRLQVATQQMNEKSRAKHWWELAIIGVLFYLAGRQKGRNENVESRILQLEQASLAQQADGGNAQQPTSLLAAKETAPIANPTAVAVVDEARQSPVMLVGSHRPQHGGAGVMDWIRSSLWASGGK